VGKTYDQLDKRLHGWIAAQHIFFVATAPHRRGGHVNLSPKGHADTFAVLDERTVAASRTPVATRSRSTTTPGSATRLVGRAQGRGRHGRLPCPAQQQEHRRPPRSAHDRQ
jgi:hypothetical protein